MIGRLDTQHQTDFVTASSQMQTPELAQQVLTAQVENALNTYRGIRSKPAEISLEFIETQLSEQSQTLAAAQESLQQFQLENEVGDLNREIAAYQDLRRTLQSDRDRAVIEAERNDRLAAEYQILADANRAKAEAATAVTEPDVIEPVNTESLLALALGQQRSAEEHAGLAEGYRAAATEYDRVLEERQQELIYLLGLQEQYEELVAGVARARSQLRLPFQQGQRGADQAQPGPEHRLPPGHRSRQPARRRPAQTHAPAPARGHYRQLAHRRHPGLHPGSAGSEFGTPATAPFRIRPAASASQT